MGIANSHAEYILEKLFLDSLLDGDILTPSELQEKFTEYQQAHPNLENPISKDIDFEVDHGGEASAGLIQTIAAALSDDAGIITSEFKRLIGASKLHYDRWSTELQRLIARTKQLEHDIDSLLLLQELSAGYFAHVGDVFSDLNRVDTTETTARINIRDNTVTLDPNADLSRDASGGTRIDLSSLTAYDVSFNLLSDSPTNYREQSNTTLAKAFTAQTTDNADCWIGIADRRKPGAVTAELKVRLSKDRDTKISRIVYVSGTQAAGGNMTISCQWSIDGYQWYSVDSVNPLRVVATDSVSWLFPMTDVRWVKFIIDKNNYDSTAGGIYRYEFGARSIRFYGDDYVEGVGGILATKSLQPLDAEGLPVTFSIVSLDVCEEVEKDITDIQYTVSVSADGVSNWTDWASIEPTSRKTYQQPLVLNVGGAAIATNTSIDTEVFDATKDCRALTNTFDDTGYNGYNFISPTYSIVNTKLSYTSTMNPNHIANSVEVWRNIFDSTDPEREVREIAAGWGYENNQYYCSFFIASSSGIFLDFGSTSCIIDGVKITGKTKIFRGVHTFRTDNENWVAIDRTNTNIYLNETILRTADPLYPYNHRLIIEGLQYSNVFDGNKIYIGTDIVAQFYGQKTSSFNLEHNLGTDYLKWFSVLKNVGSTIDPVCAVLLQRDRDIATGDYPNELCQVSWRASEGLYKYIKLRAELSTTDSYKTPLLTSYRIKVGA